MYQRTKSVCLKGRMIKEDSLRTSNTMHIRACTGFDGGLEVGEAIRSGTLR